MCVKIVQKCILCRRHALKKSTTHVIWLSHTTLWSSQIHIQLKCLAKPFKASQLLGWECLDSSQVVRWLFQPGSKAQSSETILTLLGLWLTLLAKSREQKGLRMTGHFLKRYLFTESSRAGSGWAVEKGRFIHGGDRITLCFLYCYKYKLDQSSDHSHLAGPEPEDMHIALDVVSKVMMPIEQSSDLRERHILS